MDSSRRAVETYWRARMIDAATSDEDKVTPVYKLEEICDLLRSSHVSIVKELSEFILNRLVHRSPVVKQKALRLIKYAVGKSGAEFKREMQKNSTVIRLLFHLKGQPDPLKGDALNKAVRDTAHEAISAIFSADDNKPQPVSHLTNRIEGFGNTNSEIPFADKKSLLSEVVGIGSATIKQGFSGLTQSQSLRKNDGGSYKSPALGRSLTTEVDYPDRYDRVEHRDETVGASRFTKNVTAGPWGQDLKVTESETTDGHSTMSYTQTKTREEKLLETIVTSGGVRLQPSRDALQAFLVEASKLDALALSHALETKLLSPSWQVRVKGVCVLEAILRKKDEEHFSTIASYFSEMKDAVARCAESPQASLREKAIKVLSLLDGEHTGSTASNPERPVKETSIEMPDLIDTGDPGDLNGIEVSTKEVPRDQSTSSPDLINDLLGDSLAREQKYDDPFADVSFHTGDGKEPATDLFSGMKFEAQTSTNKVGLEDFSIKKNASTVNQPISETIFSPTDVLNGNFMSSVGPSPYNLPSGMMFDPTYPSQPLNYGAMGNLFAQQQQLLAMMSNFQQFGNLQAQSAALGSNSDGSFSPLPDIFNPSIPAQTTTSSMTGPPKRDETKAFDFISDHLAAARDPKRIL